MKKYVVILLLVLFAVVGAIIYFGTDEGVTISNQIELTYTTNGGVPYEWQYEIEDESIVKFVKSYVIEDKNKDGLVGAPISTNYVFEGVKDGTTFVTFKYVSLVDGSVVRKERLKLKVKGKEISLQGNIGDE